MANVIGLLGLQADAGPAVGGQVSIDVGPPPFRQLDNRLGLSFLTVVDRLDRDSLWLA